MFHFPNNLQQLTSLRQGDWEKNIHTTISDPITKQALIDLFPNYTPKFDFLDELGYLAAPKSTENIHIAPRMQGHYDPPREYETRNWHNDPNLDKTLQLIELQKFSGGVRRYIEVLAL